MVFLNFALSTLLLAHASSHGVTAKPYTKSQFLAQMRKVKKDEDLKMRETERLRKYTDKVVAKAKKFPEETFTAAKKVPEKKFTTAKKVPEKKHMPYASKAKLYEKQKKHSKARRRLEDAAEEVEYYAVEEEVATNETEYYVAEGDAEAAEYYAEEEEEETEYYAEEEEEETEYYAEEEEEADEEVEYYTEEEEVEEQSYYGKAWGSDDTYDYSDLTFDLSKFSLKMHSCRSLTDFDLDELNKEEQEEEKQYEKEELQEISYPFSATPYVNFRLCPTSTCNDNGWQGCREVYGNYMVSLEDYFQLTAEHLEEELEEYCDYCKSCNYFYKYFNAQCEYFDQCETYGNVCNENDDGNDDDEVKYEEYLECTAVPKSYYKQYYNVAYQSGYNNRRTEEEENDENVYLKVFCDGSIKIGIFSDDECSNYIGQTTTIYEETGLTILEDDLEADFMNHKCIHCGKSDNQYYVVDQDKYQEMQNKDDDARDADDDGIYDICQNLYEESAKCNVFLPDAPEEEEENGYYNNGNYYKKQAYYGDDNNAEEEDDFDETKSAFTCAFMEAVQKGNIDKYGLVHLSRNTYFKYYINKVNNDFLPEGYYLTDNQFFAIIGATIFCFALAIYGLMKPKKTVYNSELKTSLV